uniref:WAP domain-containing protein n=1 Tax=Laticauda laticaudata TaxID=8630 RepID=A0A8C5RMF4_LATLA
MSPNAKAPSLCASHLILMGGAIHCPPVALLPCPVKQKPGVCPIDRCRCTGPQPNECWSDYGCQEKKKCCYSCCAMLHWIPYYHDLDEKGNILHAPFPLVLKPNLSFPFFFLG